MPTIMRIACLGTQVKLQVHSNSESLSPDLPRLSTLSHGLSFRMLPSNRCSSGKRADRSSARRAACSSASTMTAATTADDGIPGCGASRRPYGRSARDLGFVPFVIGTCVGALRPDAACVGRQHRHGRTVLVPVAESRQALFLFGASGGGPGLRIRSMVDGAQRRVAARRRDSHPVQHDGGASARRRRSRNYLARADGDHLHRGGGVAASR